MKFYRAAPLNTIPAGHGRRGRTGPRLICPAAVPVIAIRAGGSGVAGLARPRATGRHWWWPGTPKIGTGDQLVFVKVVAVAPALVRRDGRVQAGGHPAGCPARRA